ncbi:hypothetical protein SynBMKMC1_00151 [Synechococcus sp. BMK-MC-1]|nr:hypothetical protein SynBMKMC1_00151 [Synechococcus sp. BMK-MC-1]
MRHKRLDQCFERRTLSLGIADEEGALFSRPLTGSLSHDPQR